MLVARTPKGRFFVLTSVACGLLIQLVSGTGYFFPAYSLVLKRELDYNQTEINILAGMESASLAFCWIVGIVFDTFGPAITLSFACGFTVLGYFSVFAVVKDLVVLPFILLVLAYLIINVGNQFAYFATISANLRNLPPKSRGAVVGCLVGMYGLSAGILTLVWKHFLSPNLSHLMLFLLAAVGFANFLGVMFVRLVDGPGAKSSPDGSETVEESAHGPLVAGPPHPVVRINNASQGPCISSRNRLENVADSAKAETAPLLLTPDCPLLDIHGAELLTNGNFWLLFCTYGLAAGPGLMMIGNINALGRSAGASKSLSTTLVLIASLASVSGRVVIGVLSDKTYSKWKTPRAVWLAFACAVMTVCSFLLALVGTGSVFLLVLLITIFAVLNGSIYTSLPPITSAAFGAPHFGQTYGFLRMAPALLGLLMNYVAGRLYDAHADSEHTCVGGKCYFLTLVLTGLMCGVAFAAATALSRRTADPPAPRPRTASQAVRE
eukprot:GCRY01004125.1.p1 GENE.GCRY01004125.1~~GCRY01004125.1.p1  ORF type:complete len:494 (+),score=108.26 GCRY01004125.1:211-1692(+)